MSISRATSGLSEDMQAEMRFLGFKATHSKLHIQSHLGGLDELDAIFH